MRGWDQIKWSRINQIKKLNDFDVFYEGATLDDIKQGGIGDCYFLSAIGSLTKFTNFIESHFYLDNEKNHAYGINFFINGRWQRVFVDDYFPCRMNDKNIFGEFYFSCSFQNEIWVSLIEKAWAKINGSYANIDYGGYSYEAFDCLTEAYSEHIVIKDFNQKKIWKILEDAQEKKYLMTVASKRFNFWNIKLIIYGLDEKHAYTVVKTKVIETNSGEKVKLVQLRNPYGEKEYTGDWGKCSKKWTPELKKKYNYEEIDGIFYMSFDMFYDCFEILDICKIEKNYQTSSCKINKNQAKKCQFLELIVDKDYPRTYIQLYKKNLRIAKKKDFSHKYNADNNVMGFIILAKPEKKEDGATRFKYIDSIASYETHLAIEVDKLEKGNYYIFCDVNYRYNNENYGYTVTCYHETSGNKFELNNITESNLEDSKKFLELIIYDYCSRNVKKIKQKEIEIYKLDSNNNKKFPFDILCFANHTNKTVNIRAKIENGKSICIYNDRDCDEKSTSVLKKINPSRTTSILVMRYNKKSKYDIKYDIL